jgi:hypothetical protein
MLYQPRSVQTILLIAYLDIDERKFHAFPFCMCEEYITFANDFIP